jgi:uroporphyrinogen-III synthase
MHALITRPEEDAQPLAEALRARGLTVTVEPLLSVAPVAGASVDLAGVQALLFTSANGARALAALSPRRDLPVLAVGDASATVARSLGFVAVTSAAGNVEDLARLAQDQLDPARGALLHVAGSAVAGDLAGRLAAAGFETRRAVLYEARAADRLSPETRRRLAQGELDWVLFFSPRTAATFVELARAAGLKSDCARATALCLSPAVAAAASALPWRAVESAARPDLSAMLEMVDGIMNAPKTASAIKMAATKAPAEHPRPASGFGSVLGLLASMAAAAVVAAVVATALRAPEGEGPSPAPVATALLARVSGLETRLDDLARALAAGPGLDAGLAGRLAAIGTRLDRAESDLKRLDTTASNAVAAEPTPEMAGLPARLDEFERRLAETMSAPATAADTLAALKVENERLRTEMAALTGELMLLRGQVTDLQGQSASRAALVLAVGQLRSALNGDEPFAGEVAALQALAGDDTTLLAAVAGVAPWAETGAPTLARLQAEFPALADAALAPSEGAGSWSERLLARLGKVVRVRRVGADVEGSDLEARLARAEALLTAGDLAAAVAELVAELAATEPPAPALDAWLNGARGRLAAEAALSQLAATAATMLGAPVDAPANTPTEN